MYQKKVFLGGTCNNSKWRDKLIPMLKIDYYNPVVENWTPVCIAEEYQQKNEVCQYQLFVITPLMKGVFSIAEAVEASIKRSNDMVFCVLKTDNTDTSFNIEWGKDEYRSLMATADLIRQNGGTICTSLEEVAQWLNSK